MVGVREGVTEREPDLLGEIEGVTDLEPVRLGVPDLEDDRLADTDTVELLLEVTEIVPEREGVTDFDAVRLGVALREEESDRDGVPLGEVEMVPV